ncbi:MULTISPECIES: hypothetical protein [unclassified Solwaraspora]|uniref:hypothetical protein n=1 Tax=unclassified Solwaraspora TaxID=2627926 RepID=UPI00259BCB1F|nr:hypothetical protein [Solwaraspora sp. WMMA2056]WJK42009.1 hypothetical protein O7608_06320 [Solwaraspora sp. WMMA2056]
MPTEPGETPTEPGETPTRSADPTGPPLSRTDPPVPTRPGTPPSTPSDLITGDWLVGTVTTGGTGPCYGLVTDDGVEHALYGDAGAPLVRHTRIRVKVEPLDVRISCGPGQSWRLVRAELLR